MAAYPTFCSVDLPTRKVKARQTKNVFECIGRESVEPGPPAWQARILPLNHQCLGAVSRYSVIFLAFFARVKNGDCSRKCRGHQTMTARSAARRASPPKSSRASVVFLERISFSAAFPCGRHYFSPHKMAAKNHRLS